MSEADAIANAPEPRTRSSLAADLRALGLAPGMTVLVHSALSKLGWVCGGPVAVVQALMDVLTEQGTLIMPTFSGDLSDPAMWRNPPVPAAWVETIRATMPAFDPRVTPTRSMGAIVECFRTWPGTQRSAHPSDSFAAWGARAADVVRNHSLAYGLGEQSPLGHLYDLNGSVLLLGVGFGNNTSFHLAEYRTQSRTGERRGAPIMQNGERVWVWYDDILINDELFPEIGAAFEQTGHVTLGTVGSAEARLFKQRSAVDFAAQWLAAREAESC